jgi:NADPH:quinone reductase-like Zn-dependent oxidoreductase
MKACYRVTEGESTRLEVRAIDVPVPKEHEVLVRVRATSFNRADVFVGRGAPAHDKLEGEVRPAGTEAAGEIARVGPGVAGLVVGERVMGRASGGFAEYAIADARELMRVPERVSWEEASAIPIVFLVSYDMLFSYGRVQPGDWVLITAVSSGVGVASLLTAKAFGAKVIGTSGSRAKLETLRAHGLDEGLVTTKPDFVDAVKRVTDGRGVNVVVNAIGGSLFAACQQSLAHKGRLAMVGYTDNVFTSALDVEALHTRRQVLYGVSNRYRTAAERAETVRGFVADVLPKFADGTLKPLIDRVYRFDEIAAAKDYMEASKHVGKIVVRVS